MQKVQSKHELNQIKQLGNTIYLRKNIQQVEIETEEGTETMYEADEVVFEKENADLEHIEKNFDLYWDWANEKMENEQTLKQKRKQVRQLIDEDYDLADLQETVDQLVKDSLEG